MAEQYRGEGLIVRSVDTEKRTVTAMVSTPEVDSYGSIILPSAFAGGMDRFLSNPVLLDNHRRSEDPVGKCIDWKLSDQGLEMTFQFAPTPAGDVKLALYAGKFLRGFSVGGMIRDAVFAWDEADRKARLPEYARLAMEQGRADFVITAMELAEVSCATIPANPGALARAVSDGVIDAVTARSMFVPQVRMDAPAETEQAAPDPTPEPAPEAAPTPETPDPVRVDLTAYYAAAIAAAVEAALS